MPPISLFSTPSAPLQQTGTVGYLVGLAIGAALTFTLLPPTTTIISSAIDQAVEHSNVLVTALSFFQNTHNSVSPADNTTVYESILVFPYKSNQSSSYEDVTQLSYWPDTTDNAHGSVVHLWEQLPWSMLLSVCTTLLVIYLYHLISRPLVFSRLLNDNQRAGVLRKSYSDFPPPFPNSWYKLCDAFALLERTTLNIQALNHTYTLTRIPPSSSSSSSSSSVSQQEQRQEVSVTCVDESGQWWEVDERNHCIFLWYDSQHRSSSWQVPVVPNVENWLCVGYTTHEICCHLQEIPENGADTAHLDFLHSDFIVSNVPAAKHTWRAAWIPQPPPQQHLAQITIDTAVAVCGHIIPFTRINTRITQVGPSVVQLLFPTPFGTLLLQETITPIHSNLQRAMHVLYREPSVPHVVAKLILKSTLIQFERDFVVWNNKRWLRAPLAVKEDGPILKYRRWMKQFYDSEGGPLVRDMEAKEYMIEHTTTNKHIEP